MDLDIPVADPNQDLALARPLGGGALSSFPDSGTEDSDAEASHRRFSHLLSEKMSAGGPLLARVQKHWMPAKARSSEVDAVEADGPHMSHTKEQGTAFKQNMAMMRDTLRQDVAPPFLNATSEQRHCRRYLGQNSHMWRCRFCPSSPRG